MAMIEVAQLQKLIQTTITHNFRLPERETAAVRDAAGRVLAEDIDAQVEIPAADISAMDGYALAPAAEGSRLRVVGESLAGKPFSGSVNAGECIRIMTGAVVPAGCTVIIQENVSREDGEIVLNAAAEADKNIRRAGEEIARGRRLFPAGRILRHADIAVLCAVGLAEVSVFRKIRVAVLSGGDELLQAGAGTPALGQIYDSNRPLLLSRLRDFPVEIIDAGNMPDDLPAVENALKNAAENADVVITSGGVSVGDYDFVRDAVGQIGTIHHYSVAMKPGKPFVFGRIAPAWYFGLPGNPVSVFAGFDIFLKAALWQLCGAAECPQLLTFTAKLAHPVTKNHSRMDFQRGHINRLEDGTWLAEPVGAQDSHRIYGVSAANAYLILPADSGSLEAGENVTVAPFDVFL